MGAFDLIASRDPARPYDLAEKRLPALLTLLSADKPTTSRSILRVLGGKTGIIHRAGLLAVERGLARPVFNGKQKIGLVLTERGAAVVRGRAP